MVKGTSPSITVLPRSLPCPANLPVKLQRPPQRERAGLILALSPNSLLTSFHRTDIWMWPAETSAATANIYLRGPVMSTSHLQTHLIFTTTLWDRYYSYAHFTNEETEAQRVTCLHSWQVMDLKRYPGSLLLPVITTVRRKTQALLSWSLPVMGNTEVNHQFY